MTDLNNGDKVKWITKMMAVPHPEGKTDRAGVVLPVFRDTERTGTIISMQGARDVCSVRPDNLKSTPPQGMDTYYDVRIKATDVTKI
jgi:hypothetical protein